MESRIGELAALFTALCWTVTAVSFEIAGRRVGALTLNFLRLCLGFLFLTAYSYIFRGLIIPVDFPAQAWFWLSLSGVIGLVLGDWFLFHAFTIIGSRISMLIMASVPPLTALTGWLILGEQLSGKSFAGMILTVCGISLVVLGRHPGVSQVKFNYSLSGILYALGGALGQAIGLVLSKLGMGDYDAFSATQIRIIAGLAGFCLLFFFLRAWRRLISALRDRKAMRSVTVGSFFGPFLGVSFSLLSVQYTQTGVAATIMSIVPVIIIPPAVLLFKEKVTPREVLGALIAVAGVALMFL